MKYIVHLRQTVFEEAWITVEADTEVAAAKIAEEKAAESRDVIWNFSDLKGEIETINVEIDDGW